MIDLAYIGAFRLPPESSNGHYLDFSGRAMAFNPIWPSLFVSNRTGHVCEVSIPEPVIGAHVNDLPFAEYLQGLSDPTDGTIAEVGDDAALGGLLVVGDRLIGSALRFYDANNQQRVGHFSRDLNLSRPGTVTPWQAVWQADRQGYVAGYMAHVPPEHQQALGAVAITGQAGAPIVTRQSQGPTAFGFHPAALTGSGLVEATPYLYYPASAPLGVYEGSNEVWGGTSQVGGLVIVNGEALFFGRNGIGPFGYGPGTSVRAWDGDPVDDAPNERYCYDPLDSSKGQHAYPYRYQVWAYHVESLGFVIMDPETQEVHALDLPLIAQARQYPNPVQIGDVCVDYQRQRLYLSEMQGDEDGYGNRALIRVFSFANQQPTPEPLPPIVVTVDPRDARIAELEAQQAATRAAVTAISLRAQPLTSIPKWLKAGLTAAATM